MQARSAAVSDDARPPNPLRDLSTDLIDALKATVKDAGQMTDLKGRLEVLALCAQAFSAIDLAATERMKARYAGQR